MPTPAPTPANAPGIQHLPPGEHRHEASDVSPRAIFWTALALLAVVLLTHGVLWIYLAGLNYMDAKPNPGAHTQGVATHFDLPPEPRLQIDEAADLETIRKAESARLTTYGWIDRKAGITRVPVSRAIELVSQRGLPMFDSDKPGADTDAGLIRGTTPQTPEVKP